MELDIPAKSTSRSGRTCPEPPLAGLARLDTAVEPGGGTTGSAVVREASQHVRRPPARSSGWPWPDTAWRPSRPSKATSTSSSPRWPPWPTPMSMTETQTQTQTRLDRRARLRSHNGAPLRGEGNGILADDPNRRLGQQRALGGRRDVRGVPVQVEKNRWCAEAGGVTAADLLSTPAGRAACSMPTFRAATGRDVVDVPLLGRTTRARHTSNCVR